MTMLRIVTRKSPLALWQAEFVRGRLLATHPGLEIQMIGIHTTGDKALDAPLGRIGGKGLFIKELEQRLLEGTADIAVHSMKDVTMDLPPGLDFPVILEFRRVGFAHHAAVICARSATCDHVKQA